ncbi:hypothetical protein ACJZL1_03885 [Wolbachia endosymbiont of Rhagoletis indifferens]
MPARDAQLYEHSFLKVNCTANGVIPVLDTGIQPCRNLIKNVVF